MITCNKCAKRKSDDMFRTRTKRGYAYKQHTCKACESKAQRVRYNKIKDNEDFKEANKLRVIAYRKANPEKVKKYRKEKRTARNKKYSEYRKRYWRKNQEQREKHSVRARKYHERVCGDLEDKYVIGKILQKSKLQKEDVTPEMVQVKRLHLQLLREIKKQTNGGH